MGGGGGAYLILGRYSVNVLKVLHFAGNFPQFWSEVMHYAEGLP